MKGAVGNLSRVLPIAGWLPDYSADDARGDLQAGLTVGVMLIPQAMAYAVLAGMPPIYGLYASLVPLLVYPLLGSCRHLAVGVNAVPMVIIAAGLGAVATPGSAEYIGLALALTVVVGLVELAMGLAGLGFLSKLLARPVIAGFTIAAALIIGLSQLEHLLGLELARGGHAFSMLAEAASEAGATHLPSLGLGTAAIIVLVVLQRRSDVFPSELLVLLVGTAASWLLGLDEVGVEVVGTVPTGLPFIRLPDADLGTMVDLWPTVITLALVQFMSVVSLGRVFAARHRYSIDPNRELLGIGAANILGGLFQAIPSSGSFSRTTVNERAGARTPLSNLVAAGLVGLTLLFLTPAFRYLPLPVLGAIIVVAAASLIDMGEIRTLFRTKRSDGWVALFTAAATLAIGIQEGILLGVAAAVLVILYRLSRPHVAELGHVPATHRFHNLDRFEEAVRIPGLLILRIDASFSFFNADFFKEYILDRSGGGRPLRAVIVDGSPVNYLDSTAVDALVEVVHTLRERGVEIHFAGLKGSVRDVVRHSGLAEELGDDHFHMSPHYAVLDILESWDEEEGTGMKQTYERYRERDRDEADPVADEPYM